MGFPASSKPTKAALEKSKSSFDFILSTIPEKHDVNPFVALLERDSTMVVVGALEPLAPVNNQEALDLGKLKDKTPGEGRQSRQRAAPGRATFANPSRHGFAGNREKAAGETR